ncbi:FHA domain-containing protein [Dokdonella soli]|uniref:FHA domain-containing protein n=1 Tax=Dokdonella soli TaxID=529810 RepID=A0ABN1IGM0_9GAMM
MDEVTWIEVLSRHREVASRQRVATNAVTIGRAYDNDVVLDDPHVAAHHLRLVRGDDGAWVAEDLGSLNGLFADGQHQRQARVVLNGGTTLRIGHTGLRLRTSAQPVPAEQPLLRSAPSWPLALGCLALVFGLALLDLWLRETGEPKLIGYLTPLLTLAVMVAIWTSAWSVLSRIFGGHARFGLHLLIVGAGLLAYTLYEQASELGAFALSWTALARSVYAGAWLAFAAVCFAHLRVLGNTRLPLKAIAVLALAALGIGMQSLKQSDWRANYGQPVTLQRLEPPSLRIVSAHSEIVFFANVASLKAGLDKARSEEPAGGESGAEMGGGE